MTYARARAFFKRTSFRFIDALAFLLRQSVCPTAIYLDTSLTLSLPPLDTHPGFVVSSLNIAIFLAYRTGIRQKYVVRSKEEATIILYIAGIILETICTILRIMVKREVDYEIRWISKNALIRSSDLELH